MMRKIYAMLLAALLVVGGAAVVEAAEMELYDSGYFVTTTDTKRYIYYDSTGDYSTFYPGIYVKAALDENYTYTITANVKTESGTSWMTTLDTVANMDTAISSSWTNEVSGTLTTEDNYLYNYVVFSSKLLSDGTNQLTFTFHTSASTWGEIRDPAYIYFLQLSGTNTSYSVSSISITAEADPYGEIYKTHVIEHLNELIAMQREQLEAQQEFYSNVLDVLGALDIIVNAGDQYITSIPSNGGELQEKVDSMESAESAIKDKSTALQNNVSSQWNSYKTTMTTTAQNYLPVAAFVSTVWTDTKDNIPDYVKGLFIICPMILFVGWLIGRFK